jgi:hypothetical protein
MPNAWRNVRGVANDPLPPRSASLNPPPTPNKPIRARKKALQMMGKDIGEDNKG